VLRAVAGLEGDQLPAPGPAAARPERAGAAGPGPAGAAEQGGADDAGGGPRSVGLGASDVAHEGGGAARPDRLPARAAYPPPTGPVAAASGPAVPLAGRGPANTPGPPGQRPPPLHDGEALTRSTPSKSVDFLQPSLRGLAAQRS